MSDFRTTVTFPHDSMLFFRVVARAASVDP